MLNQTVVDVYGNRDKSVSQNSSSHHHLLDKETPVIATGNDEEDSGVIRPEQGRPKGKKSRGKQKKRHWEEKISNEGAELAEDKKKSELLYNHFLCLMINIKLYFFHYWSFSFIIF